MKYNSYQRRMDASNALDKVKVAFGELRKKGLIARMNFACCGSCAGYEISTAFGEMPEKRRSKVKGYVTFDRQDTDGFLRTGEMYVNYGQIEYFGDSGKVQFASSLDTRSVGDMVINELTKAGVVATWDGNPDEAIRVYSSAMIAPRVTEVVLP